jgi:uncharacterized surface protein with fasciclin (FAS1) repeats
MFFAAGTIEDLKKPDNKIELRRILQAQVLPNRITTNEMKDSMPMKTAQGEEVIAKYKGKTLTVGNAKVLIADINASNGVIYLMDEVLVPPKQ